jgi:tellurium resistance protein TerD
MPVSLAKGSNVSLTKEAPGLKSITVGLGWDVRVTDGAGFDLDSAAFLLNAEGKVRSGADFIFYNKLQSDDGSVRHSGDNRDGVGEGDDECIRIDLPSVPPEIQRIAVTVTIHEADTRRQNFGQISRAFMRVVDDAAGAEIARFDLTEDMSTETALVFGEIYRHGGEWKFRAVGQGFAGGLSALALSFGVEV